MIEIKGKYNTAKIFTDTVDEESLKQIQDLLSCKFVEGSRIRFMPDIHAGAGCVIGTTMTLNGEVVPNMVGVDIGCGIECTKLEEKEIDLEKLDKVIHERIPSGFNIRKTPHKYFENCGDLKLLRCMDAVNLDRAARSLGTLGGGNHYIECGKDENGNIYLTVHSGSRHLGLEVANYYQKEAYEQLKAANEVELTCFIDDLKEQGLSKEISSRLEVYKASFQPDIPKALAYAYGELADLYFCDVCKVVRFAEYNRKAITDEILEAMGLHIAEQFTTIHNYVGGEDSKSMILRKGAVSAEKGEKLIIPMNMRDGSLICIGKGNPDWNFSAPHGAGRLMSRKAAKENLVLSDYEKQMEGIYTTSVNKGTIDEAPMAYKPMSAITENIKDTVDIISVIKPIYNFKAGE